MPDRMSPVGGESFRSGLTADAGLRVPVDGPDVDEAASQFSSLMEGDAPRSREPRESPGNEPRDSASAEPGEEERRKSDDKSDSKKSTEPRTDQRERDTQLSRHHGSGGHSHHDGEQQNQSPGDAILQAFGGHEPLDAQPTETVAAASGASETMDAIVHEVASQVLVSDPATGGREVRITLKDSIMPGTEVRITENAGKLEVQFVTKSADSQNMLTENQMALQDRLTEKLGHRDVVVTVKYNAEGQGDQQDGRSRQQRSVIDELNAEENTKRGAR